MRIPTPSYCMPTYQQPKNNYSQNGYTFAPIKEVPSAIPVFIGYTEKAKNNEDGDLLFVPKKIKNLVEYVHYFGHAFSEKNITVNIDSSQSTNNITATINQRSKYLMYYALKSYFSNGGESCYIMAVGNYSEEGGIHDRQLIKGLSKTQEVDEITLNVFPDAIHIGSSNAYYKVIEATLKQFGELGNRFTICDVYMHNDSNINDVDVFRGSLNNPLKELKNGAAYYPYLEMEISYRYNENDITINKDGVPTPLSTIKNLSRELYKNILISINNIPVILPPSVAIAGIYARIDKTKGVWKAPANVKIDLAKKPILTINHEVQQTLNIDPLAGKSINGIRVFSGRGVMVWGSRTLAGNDNEWRYISVRRFFMLIEASIKNGIQQFLFESNEAETWELIKSMIENYLTSIWRSGALAGPTPESSFFVTVGLNETMTPLDVQNGILHIEIGLAMIRPAEFIRLKISHQLAVN